MTRANSGNNKSLVLRLLNVSIIKEEYDKGGLIKEKYDKEEVDNRGLMKRIIIKRGLIKEEYGKGGR